MSRKQVDLLLAKTKDAALKGEFEPFKTTAIFDGTARNPGWMGKELRHFPEMMPPI
jgi:hypothetical protein